MTVRYEHHEPGSSDPRLIYNPRRPWRPTDPGCEHVATVPIEPRVNADGIVLLRRCLYCKAEVQR